MQQYQVIARQFRPQKFAEVCGQKRIVQTIQNAISLGRTSHAYLFCGPRGCGKTTLARLFAKALNCKNPSEEGEPCGQCHCCQEINMGQSLDVIEIDGASNRGIDDIRQLNETVGYTPSSSAYKIYIIDEVHMLTKEAFNALLKTLEEPPPQVKFFLATTEPHKVLATIASRCLRFDLMRIPEEIMLEKLGSICTHLNIEVEKEALSLIVQKAEGSLRDAQSMLDGLLCLNETPLTKKHACEALGFMPGEIFDQMDQAFAQKQTSSAFTIAAEIFSYGVNYAFFFESLMDYYKNIFLAYDDPQHPYKEKTKTYSRSQCEKILQILTELLVQKPFQKKIQLEMALLKILNVSKEVSADELIARLDQLQNQPYPPQPNPSNDAKKPHNPDQKKASEVVLEAKSEEKSSSPEPVNMEKQIKTDNLVRFAAVELNGFVK